MSAKVLLGAWRWALALGQRNPRETVGPERLHRNVLGIAVAYVAGLRDGFLFYGGAERVDNPTTKPLYCFPKGIALSTEQAEEIIRRWAGQHKDTLKDDNSVGLALLLGLEQNFPCQ